MRIEELREALAAVGAEIPLDAIAAWTVRERERAAYWVSWNGAEDDADWLRTMPVCVLKALLAARESEEAQRV